MRRFWLYWLGLGLLLALARSNAQDTVFTSNSNLVVIDVNVKDRAGNPIPNLKKEDFTLL